MQVQTFARVPFASLPAEPEPAQASFLEELGALGVADEVELARLMNGEVSPETLMGFLGFRLGEIDRAVAKEVTTIDHQGKASNAISERRELLDQIAGQIRLVTSKTDEGVKLGELHVEWQGQKMTAREALVSAGLTADVAIKHLGADGLPTDDSKITLANVETASSKLEKEQRRLTSDNDLRMLRLQDAMNRRSQLVQMVSNFMRAIQDAQRTIVGNMR